MSTISPLDGKQRIYVTGGPGSGKTTLAGRISTALDLPHYDMDALWTAVENEGRPFADLAADAERVARSDRWVFDGFCAGWAEPVHQRADLIVYLEIPWRVTSYRILMRHFKRSATGTNQYPGLQRLFRFWRSTCRYYLNLAEPGLSQGGLARTQTTAEKLLGPHAAKVVRCRNQHEIDALFRQQPPRARP